MCSKLVSQQQCSQSSWRSFCPPWAIIKLWALDKDLGLLLNCSSHGIVTYFSEPHSLHLMASAWQYSKDWVLVMVIVLDRDEISFALIVTIMDCSVISGLAFCPLFQINQPRRFCLVFPVCWIAGLMCLCWLILLAANFALWSEH